MQTLSQSCDQGKCVIRRLCSIPVKKRLRQDSTRLVQEGGDHGALDFSGQRVFILVFGGDSSRTRDVRRNTPGKLRVWTCSHMVEIFKLKISDGVNVTREFGCPKP